MTLTDLLTSCVIDTAAIGARTLPRKWSVAAALLDLARQAARARMN
jgi:hypothetical protein